MDGKLIKEEMETVLQNWKLKAENIEKVGTHRHIFSHVEWDMVGFKVMVEEINQEFIWVDRQELFEKYAIPGAFSKFRDRIKGQQ